MPLPRRMRNPAPPGQVLRDLWLEASPAEAAQRLGLDPAELEALLAAKIPMTPCLALALEAGGLSNADFWMRVQAAYDLAQERLRRERASSVPGAADRLWEPAAPS